MAFKLSNTSLTRLQGVDPRLVAVVKRAIELTAMDFAVLEGLRSLEQQKKNVANKASQTMASRHLKQSDGLGKAVDLVAWVNGGISWEWDHYLPIADAVRRAARELKVPIRYGGGWFRLDQLESKEAIAAATKAYTDGKRKAGQKAFLDGPHFEIPAGL